MVPRRYGYSSFRTVGVAGAQNLLSIELGAMSTRVLHVTSIRLWVAMAELSSTVPIAALSRTVGLPANGTVLAGVSLDTELGGAPEAVVRGATASHGGAATAIVAVPGANARSVMAPRLLSVAGVDSCDLRPLHEPEDEPFVLRANEGCVVHVDTSGSERHYLLDCIVEELG